MGGFNPITTVLGAASSALSLTKPARQAYGDYRTVTAAYDRAKDSYAGTERDIAEKDALEQKQLAVETAEAASQRKKALQRVVAKQQAAYGGQGIDTTDGSGEAVMLGLFQESEDDKKYRNRLDQLKRESLQQDTAAKRRRNLLAVQQSYAAARDGLISNIDDYL